MKTKHASIAMSSVHQKTEAPGIDTWFNRQALNFEKARFGWMALYIIIQSCLGSIACMYISQTEASDVMLITCAVVTMASNAVFIAQSPAKWCLASFYLSLVVNAAFILMCL